MIYPMIPPPTATFSPSEEKEARRLLLSRKSQDTDALPAWISSLAPATATDLLAKIAGDAKQVRYWVWLTIGLFGAITATWIIGHWYNAKFPTPPFFLVCLVSAIGASHQNNARAGRKAAFLLADRNDYRAVAPLARLWEVRPRCSGTGQAENAAIERALTRLLTMLTAYKYENGADESVRDLLSRAFPPASRRPTSSTLTDLSDTRADLMLSALRYLAHATPGKDSTLTHELIARIASAPTSENTPNRAAVHETAALCLDPAYNATPLAAVAPAAQMVSIKA